MIVAEWYCQRCKWSGKTEDLFDKKTDIGVIKVCPKCFKRDELV